MNQQPKIPIETSTSRKVLNNVVSFGGPPLLPGEDAAAYEDLHVRISGAVRSGDILEEIWVRDVVDLVWETFRLRRLKANLMMTSAHRGIEIVLENILTLEYARDLANGWAARLPDAIQEVDETLASAGLTMDAVMAQTLSVKIDDIERIDHMIMTSEARRNIILREIDRHRTTFGQTLRRAAEDVEDAQFEVVTSADDNNKSIV